MRVGIAVGAPLEADQDVGLLVIGLHDSLAALVAPGQGAPVRHPSRGRRTVVRPRRRWLSMLDAAGRCHHHARGAVMARRDRSGSPRDRNPSTVSGVPRMRRPIGWPAKAVSPNRSKTRSSGVSSTAPISCRMTFFSRSSSVGVEDRVGQDVGEDVEAEPDVRLQHAGIIGGLLDRGRGVQLAARRFRSPRRCAGHRAAACP